MRHPPSKGCDFIQFVWSHVTKRAINQIHRYPIGNSRVTLPDHTLEALGLAELFAPVFLALHTVYPPPTTEYTAFNLVMLYVTNTYACSAPGMMKPSSRLLDFGFVVDNEVGSLDRDRETLTCRRRILCRIGGLPSSIRWRHNPRRPCFVPNLDLTTKLLWITKNLSVRTR